MAGHNGSIILIVDDETIVRQSFCEYLEAQGYEILEAADGQTALETCEKHEIDLILVDLRMPGMSGLEVLETIRARDDNMPVIVISGTGDITDVVGALRRGAWDYLLKPIRDMSIIVHAIESGLERARLRRENRAYQEVLEQRVDEKTRELRIINSRLHEVVESTKRLLGCKDLNEGGRIILEEFGRHMKARGGSIYRIANDGLHHIHSLDPSHAAPFLPFPLKTSSPFATVLGSGNPLLVHDIESDDSLEGSSWPHYTDNSMLIFPILGRNGAAIAVISLHSGHTPPFVEVDREIGQILASYASEVLQGAQMVEILKRKEELLSQAQKMEAMGTLAGGIAHDFNNILSAIIGYTDLSLYAPALPAPIVKNLEQIKKASNRARDLVQQILSFSRMEGFREQVMDISPVIKEALKLLRAIIPSSIIITRDIPGGLGRIRIDPTRVHQVLMNLCSNATQAIGEEGEISIRCSTLVRSDYPPELIEITAETCLCLSVEDNGKGIEPELLPRIFDPYYTTKEKGEGTGLGLAVVQGIVTQGGGVITVRSEVGKGSVFSLYFPVVSEQRDDHKQAQEDIMPRGTERILFIDDEATLAEVAQEMLEKLGYQVVVETSSAEGLRLLRESPGAFDLLITDQTMPALSGLDLAREAISMQPELPVILCTGYSTAIDGTEARAIGIREFLMKPVSMMNLATVVRAVLDGQRSQTG